MDKEEPMDVGPSAGGDFSDYSLPVDYELYQHPEGSLKYRKGHGSFDGACLPAYYQQLLEQCKGRYIKPFSQQASQGFLGVNGYYPHALAVLWVSEHLAGKSLWASTFCQEKEYSGVFLNKCMRLSQSIKMRMAQRPPGDIGYAYAVELEGYGVISSNPDKHFYTDNSYAWPGCVHKMIDDPGCYVLNIYNFEKRIHKLLVVSIDCDKSLYANIPRPVYLFDPICGEMFFENYKEMLHSMRNLPLDLIEDAGTRVYLSKWSGNTPHRYGPPPMPTPWFVPPPKTWKKGKNYHYHNRYVPEAPHWLETSLMPKYLPEEIKLAKEHGGVCTRVFTQGLVLLFSGVKSEGICYAMSAYWLACHMYDNDFWQNVESDFFQKKTFDRNRLSVLERINSWTNSYPLVASESKQSRESAYFPFETSIGLRSLCGEAPYDLTKSEHVINDLRRCSYKLIIMKAPGVSRHAVAIAACGGDICFFDPNVGEIWFPKVEGFVDWFSKYIGLVYSKEKYSENDLLVRGYERNGNVGRYVILDGAVVKK